MRLKKPLDEGVVIEEEELQKEKSDEYEDVLGNVLSDGDKQLEN